MSLIRVFASCLVLLHLSEADIVNTTGCGVTKGCLSSSDVSLVTWSLSSVPGYVDIELSAVTDGWVAVAFSEDTRMESDSVTECVLNGSVVQVQQSYNADRHVNQAATNPQAGIVAINTSYTNGRLECRLMRSISSANNDPQFYNLNGTSYFIMLGYGPLALPGQKGQHATEPVISAQKIDLLSTNYTTQDNAPRSVELDPMVKAHGCLMLAAWILTASTGIVIARHYKQTFAGKRACNEQLWLLIHRICLMTAVFANIAGFIVIFIHVGGYSDVGTVASSFMRAHPPMGIIVTCLVVINPLFMILRPKPGKPGYKWMTIIHRSIGSLLHPIAAVTMFAGIVLRFRRTDVSSDPLFWLMLSTVIVQFLAELILFIHAEATKPNTNNTGLDEVQDNQIKVEVDGDKLASYKKFRLVFLPLYLTIMAALYIAMTIVIATYTIELP